MDNDVSSLLPVSEDIASAVRQLQLEDADDMAQEQSADEARRLLRWLSNLPSADMPLDEWLEAATPEEAAARAGSLAQLVKIFIRKLKQARRKRPDIMRDAVMERGWHAAAAMAQAVISFTLAKLSAGHPQAAALAECVSALPPQATMRQAQSVKRLAETAASGMERASGKNVSGKSAPERLVEIGTRLQSVTRSLRSIESLEPPAREESIELAREILRRLRNLGFSDKPLKAMIDAGTAQDKAAFVEAVDEAAEMYKNLVLEAAEINPDILQDKQIREAGEALSTFAHGVKLMAAKEMPNSIASAQQISADATQSPEEWDRLHDRTVDRLVKSMEGGLEKAVNDIENEQEQQRQEEQQQEAVDTALQSADHHGKRRRKRRRRHRSGSGGRKQLKEKLALEADDYVLKQGRFGRDSEKARHQPAPPIMSGLSPEALAAVKQLGSALLMLGQQAQSLSAALTAAPQTAVAPDDRTIAQRVIDEQQKAAKNQGLAGV